MNSRFDRSMLIGLLFVALIATVVVRPVWSESSQTRLQFRPSASLCEAEWQWYPYVGRGHIHTLYSTPAAFGHGSNKPTDADHAFSAQPIEIVLLAVKAAFNFVLFSDHGEGLTPGAWLILKEVATRAAAVGLLSIHGFEWTQLGAFDKNCLHVNVFNTTWFAGTHAAIADWQGQPAPTFIDLQKWLDGLTDNWYMTLNHPWLGQGDFGNPYSSTVKRRTPAIEVIGGSFSRHHADLVAGERYLCWALGHGWEVAPTSGDDNFDTPFGAGVEDLTEAIVVWLPRGIKLTTANFIRAMLARRATVRLEPWDFRLAGRSQAGSCPFGSHLSVKTDELIDIGVRLAGPTPALAGSVTIVLKGVDRSGKIIDLVSFPFDQLAVHQTGPHQERITYAGTVRFAPNARALGYFAVVSHDGRPVLLSAPIFLDIQPAATRPRLAIESRADWSGVPIVPFKQLEVHAGMQVMIRLSRSAVWTQAVRLSDQGKRPIVLVLDNNWQEFSFPFVRESTGPTTIWVEAFHFHPVAGWRRTTHGHFETRGKTLFLYCEDGDDTDYDDLIIEASQR